MHLLPLPGSPRESPGLAAVERRAVADAHALLAGGVDAIIVENLGDAPFEPGAVAPYTVAAMTRLVDRVQAAVDCPLGVNVLRNDARAALSIAAAVGAAFIRVNIHIGAMVTDQGVIEGRARETLLERQRLGADVRIIADVLVKHAAPLGAWTLEDAARDTARRGGADALVITGSGTGLATDADELRRCSAAVPGTPVWVGSGVTPERIPAAPFDGAIVGTALHENSDLDRPIEVARVRQVRQALDAR